MRERKQNRKLKYSGLSVRSEELSLRRKEIKQHLDTTLINDRGVEVCLFEVVSASLLTFPDRLTAEVDQERNKDFSDDHDTAIETKQ